MKRPTRHDFRNGISPARTKLDGEKTELRLEELPIRRSAVILCADSWLTLFEYEGSWYYHVAADPAPRRSRLDPDALRALAGK